jgi:hypothetical protein
MRRIEMGVKEKAFVTFFSPGTLFSETTTKSIDNWDCKKAVEMSKGIKERHGATPYGFQFSKRLVASPLPDGQGGVLEVVPKTVEESGMYFLGGKLRTYDEVLQDNKKDDDILRSNMRANGFAVTIENTNSYRSTHSFEANDKIVDLKTGEVVRSGDDEDLKEYRKKFEEMRK